MVSKTALLFLGGAAAIAGAGAVYAVSKGVIGGLGLFKVTIRVIDSVTGAAIRYATVTISSLGGGVTDANGQVYIPSIPAGNHAVTVDALGYSESVTTIDVSQSNTTFVVSMTQTSGCVPQTCPCGSKWDPVACRCGAQVPNFMDVLLSSSAHSSWYVAHTWSLFGGDKLCGTWIPDELSCPSQSSMGCSGLNGDTMGFQIAVTVKDINGDPVCGATLSAALLVNSLQLPWKVVPCTGYGCCSIQGDFALSLGPVPPTDAYGKTTVTVYLKIENIGHTGCSCIGNPLCPSCSCESGSASPSFPVSVALAIPGTQVVQTTQLVLETLICGYGYPSP